MEEEMKVNEITKDKWDAYKTVRGSGVTNMFSTKDVIKYAKLFADVELTKEDCICIMKNYKTLEEKYK